MSSVQDLAVDLSFRDLALAREALAQARNTVTGVGGVIVTLEAILLTGLVRDATSGQLILGLLLTGLYVVVLAWFLTSTRPKSLKSHTEILSLIGSQSGSVQDEKARLARTIGSVAQATWGDVATVQQRAVWVLVSGALVFAGLGVLTAHAGDGQSVSPAPAMSTSPSPSATP